MQNFIDLLKQTNRLLQETDSFIRFDLQGHRYQYDIEQNRLACESEQGLKPLDKQAENELCYLLKYEIFAIVSQQALTQLKRGELDPALKQSLQEITLDAGEEPNIVQLTQRLRIVEDELRILAQHFNVSENLADLQWQKAELEKQLSARRAV